MYVIFKEFGNYRITNEKNYNANISNASAVYTLHNCNSYEEALACAIGAGWSEECIINKTEE